MQLDEFSSLNRGFIALTNWLRGKLKGGPNRYKLNPTGSSKVKGYRLSSEFKLRDVRREIKEHMRSVKRIGTHSMPMTDDGKKGPRSSDRYTESDIERNITR